jgi:hypothetical protein
LSAVGATVDSVQVTARDVERIPPGNLRVPRDEFAAVWAEVERLYDEKARTGQDDWYTTGVALTCEWLATAIVPSIVGGMRPARAPVSKRMAAAHEELIEYEVLAAERLAAQPSKWIDPEWLAAVVNTLAWAWKGTAGPPIDMRRADAG